MGRKLIIEKNALTVKVAELKDDTLVRFYIHSLMEREMENKIVIGQVMQVVKNLKAAFVDYGADKNGMLHFKQIPEAYNGKIQPGMRLPVQIVKQNIGEKGHKLTAKLNVTGRYLVCLPFEPGINISKKITDQTLRKEIKETLLAVENPDQYGFIVRTHGACVPAETLAKDAASLIAQVKKLIDTKDFLAKGNVLYEEMGFIEQLVCDAVMDKEPFEVICNDALYLENIKSCVMHYPYHEETVFHVFNEQLSIWSYYSLTKKIDELLKRKIWLKNGGNLIIDYTEAMTIIDVNSAKAILTKNPDKAVFELNKEAVHEAILQILRRNLSGMIIIDLVEMKNAEHKKLIYEYAKSLLEQYEDKRTKVYPLTELGLLQFSRTKKHQCIPHQLLQGCKSCQLPYAEKSFLYDMMAVEEKAKQSALTSERQAIYLEVSPGYEEKMKEHEVIRLLESKYFVDFIVKKTGFSTNKNILCQFYSK